MRNLIKDVTGGFGNGDGGSFSVPLNKVEALVSKYDVTYAAFVHLLVCLAQKKYNNKDSYLLTFLENRSPNENAAGMRMSNGAIGITTESRKLEDLFKDMSEQQHNMIRYSYYHYASYHPIEDDYSYLWVSYIADWFDSDSNALFLGKQLILENQYLKYSKARPLLYLRVMHEKGRMVFIFQYDAKHLSAKHAKDFMSLLEHTANELLEERVPE